MLTQNKNFKDNESMTLLKTNQGWFGRYSGCEEYEEILIGLFGTRSLPLPFTSKANFNQVADYLESKHPNLFIIEA